MSERKGYKGIRVEGDKRMCEITEVIILAEYVIEFLRT